MRTTDSEDKTCMLCGAHIPAGMTYLEVYAGSPKELIGARCYTTCKGPRAIGAVEAYKRRILEMLQINEESYRSARPEGLEVLATFIVNTIKMRDAQKTYFKKATRTQAALERSKELEKIVDEIILLINSDNINDACSQCGRPHSDHVIMNLGHYFAIPITLESNPQLSLFSRNVWQGDHPCPRCGSTKGQVCNHDF